jgi:LuxR family transcriptional regulator, quorum-sensing system regulator LasR
MNIDLDAILSEFRGADQSPEGAIKTFARLGNALGYDHVVAEYLPEKSSGRKIVSASNYSEKWTEESSRLPLVDVLRDPILQHLDSRVDPIVWDERDYVNADLSSLYERYYGHGIGSGIALSVRGSKGDYVCVGFSNSQRLEKSELQPTRQLGSLFIAASAMFNSMKGQPKPSNDRPLLTPREIECLKWAHVGKTGWETSMILGISQATATFHLKNAIQKLEASNKTHAVVCAVQRGLIS